MKKNRTLINLMLVGLMLAVGGGFCGCEEDIAGVTEPPQGFLIIRSKTNYSLPDGLNVYIQIKKNINNDGYHHLEYDENNLTEYMTHAFILVSGAEEGSTNNWDFYEYITIYDSNTNFFLK